MTGCAWLRIEQRRRRTNAWRARPQITRKYHMPFNEPEARLLLAQKGVGKTVLARLEEAGFHTLADLAEQDAESVCALIAQMRRSPCWKNSPLARQAIKAVIALARSEAGRLTRQPE